MSREIYELISMYARYWFCGLMVLIVFRAWRVTVVDNRRAALLRAWSPETGCVGEFVINPGRTKRQVSVPIPREGVLGSARRADVRIIARDVKRYHATLEQREGGLLVCPRGTGAALLNGTHTGPALFMRDGDTLTIGRTKLLLVMFDPEPAEAEDDFTDETLWRDYDDPQDRPATKPRAGQSNKRKPVSDDLSDFEDDLWPNV